VRIYQTILAAVTAVFLVIAGAGMTLAGDPSLRLTGFLVFVVIVVTWIVQGRTRHGK
jgi:hypothetical protein